MKNYKELTTKEKYAMLWPAGTKVRRLGTSSDFDPTDIYELSKNKDKDSASVCILKNKHGKLDGGRDSQYFELVSLPGEVQEVNNNYQIY